MSEIMALISKERILKHWDGLNLTKKVEKVKKIGYEINESLSITYEMKCEIFRLDNPHLKGETIVNYKY